MDFAADKKTYNIDDQFMFGSSMMVCPVTEYMYNKPPMSSVLVSPSHFTTVDGKTGLTAQYYKDIKFSQLGVEKVDSCINLNWYSTGRPDYVTDSTLSIRWKGKLTADETGDYQFHIKCLGTNKHIRINGKELAYTYSSDEASTEIVKLEAGKTYDFEVDAANETPGAFHVELYWKTPSIFAQEKVAEKRELTRKVYLPANTTWYDFWTGKTFDGGQTITADAPIDKIPLFVKAGSILPMGPFVQYAVEKNDAPLELRIYQGANGTFELYEDENDNYNYEKGLFATIKLTWEDAQKQLTIGKREGSYPGMAENRIFNVVIVKPGVASGIDIVKTADKSVNYNGQEQVVKF